MSAFFPEETDRTTKEIEDRSGYSHERAYSTLKALEKSGILSKKKVGKAHVFSIRRFNDIVYLSFAFYSINRKNRFIKRYPFVWNALDEFLNKTRPDLAIIFGSYSKEEAKEKSDIDIL